VDLVATGWRGSHNHCVLHGLQRAAPPKGSVEGELHGRVDSRLEDGLPAGDATIRERGWRRRRPAGKERCGPAADEGRERGLRSGCRSSQSGDRRLGSRVRSGRRRARVAAMSRWPRWERWRPSIVAPGSLAPDLGEGGLSFAMSSATTSRSVPKGRQDLAGGFSRRIADNPQPSPEGTTPSPGGFSRHRDRRGRRVPHGAHPPPRRLDGPMPTAESCRPCKAALATMRLRRPLRGLVSWGCA